MDPLISTLLLILLALLGARFSFSPRGAPAGPRLLFRTGTHWIFVGFLLGPNVLELLTPGALGQLDPLMALGLGWVGFLFGLQLDRENLGQFPLKYHALAAGQAVVAFLLFLGLGWAGLALLGRSGEEEMLLLSAAAATACITTPAGIAMISANFFVRGELRRLLFFVASVDAVVGVTALQIVYTVFHPGSLVLGTTGVPTAGWSALALGLGVVYGIFFLWLTRPRPGPEELVLYLLGISALASGSALQLQLSPLFVSMVMGAFVANLHDDRQRIFAALERWEKPIYLVLLLVAGAFLRFPTLWILPLAILYAGMRTVGKVAGATSMAGVISLSFPTPRLLGLGLIPQGGISLAMAISVLLTYGELELSGFRAVELFFGIVVVGVVISELVGPFFTFRVLRGAGEISPRVERALEEGDEERAQEEALRHVGPAEPGGGNAGGDG